MENRISVNHFILEEITVSLQAPQFSTCPSLPFGGGWEINLLEGGVGRRAGGCTAGQFFPTPEGFGWDAHLTVEGTTTYITNILKLPNSLFLNMSFLKYRLETTYI